MRSHNGLSATPVHQGPVDSTTWLGKMAFNRQRRWVANQADSCYLSVTENKQTERLCCRRHDEREVTYVRVSPSPAKEGPCQ